MGTPNPDDLPYTIDPATYEYIKQLPKRESVSWEEMYPYANPLSVDLLSKLLVNHILIVNRNTILSKDWR